MLELVGSKVWSVSNNCQQLATWCSNVGSMLGPTMLDVACQKCSVVAWIFILIYHLASHHLHTTHHIVTELIYPAVFDSVGFSPYWQIEFWCHIFLTFSDHVFHFNFPIKFKVVSENREFDTSALHIPDCAHDYFSQKIIQAREEEQKLSLAKMCKLFQSWPLLSLKKIAGLIKWRKFLPGQGFYLFLLL